MIDLSNINWQEILFAVVPVVIAGILAKAHAAGRRMPILEKIFDWVNGTKKPTPDQPGPVVPADPKNVPAPAPDTSTPILDLLARIIRAGGAATLTSDATGQTKLKADLTVPGPK